MTLIGMQRDAALAGTRLTVDTKREPEARRYLTARGVKDAARVQQKKCRVVVIGTFESTQRQHRHEAGSGTELAKLDPGCQACPRQVTPTF